MYLYLKAFHIIFFTSWFAGLFYLPRIYVNLAMTENDDTYNHLLIMSRKLYRFITPFMYITAALGFWMLYLNPFLLSLWWMQVKLALVASLIIYHFVCGYHLKLFTNRQADKSHVFYRFFNEYPVLILFSVVILAILKYY
ncbi:MAG: CopD family protein [Gammaproteobacteria bacterium]|nr:CopD family protein [Gammaproteobacteria bacterium]MDH5629339.1 CopD family protein [Gammaproteobacteria bacterium]